MTLAPQDSWYSLGGAHAYRLLLPVERYGEQHPEWFNKLDAGNRPSTASRSTLAAQQYAHNATQYMQGALGKGIPAERILIWNGPCDGTVRCELPENRALVHDDGSATSLVVNFGNLVAERILGQ